MKPFRALLALSLAANVALLAAYVFVPREPSPTSARTTPPVSKSPATARGTSGGNGSAKTPEDAKLGARLASDDLPSLIARLRAAGFPPDVLRAIVNQRFELRREELTRDGLDTPYWKTRRETPPDPKVAAELAQLERDRILAVKTLIGPNESSDGEADERTVLRQRQYGNLPAVKITQIEALQQKYGEQLRALDEGGPKNSAQPPPMEKINQLFQQQHAEIAALLTPDELHEYDLRNGTTSSRLRNALTGFNPTEAEYRALYPLYQAQEAQYLGTAGPANAAQLAAFGTTQQQMEEQIKGLLSPERYAEYQQSSRPEYQQLNSLVTRLELPLSAATQVVSVQQEIQQRVNAVRTDPALSPTERADRLAALAQEASTKIGAVIGARGLEGYRQNGGQWLQQLLPRAPKANPKGQ